MSLKLGHRAIFQASVLPGVRAPELLLNSEEIAKFTPEVGYWKPGRHGESNSSAAVPKGTSVKSPSGPRKERQDRERTEKRTNRERTTGPRKERPERERTTGQRNERPDRTEIVRLDRKHPTGPKNERLDREGHNCGNY